MRVRSVKQPNKGKRITTWQYGREEDKSTATCSVLPVLLFESVVTRYVRIRGNKRSK